MSLQHIFNISNKIQFNNRKLVGIQYSRSQIPKTEMTPTKNPWRFSISVPSQPYNSMRSVIQTIDSLDRYQPETIQLGANTGMSWMFRYQGTMTDAQVSAITVDSFTGNQLVLTNLPSVAAEAVLFEPGDFIQIGNKYYPFTSTGQVLRGSSATVTITTHRPNILTSSVVGNNIVVGSNCKIEVFCPNMPTYSLTPGAKNSSGNTLINNALVEWDSEFQFYEWLGNA
jgi:hypothetical protein